MTKILTYYNNDCRPTDMSKGRREAAEIAARAAQNDAHVRAFDLFIITYGSMEGYYLAKARKARSTAQLMLTPSGRDFIWRRNNEHSEYRRGR